MIDPRGFFADLSEDDEQDPFFLEEPDFAGTLARLSAGEQLRPGQMRHLGYARQADLPAWMAFWNSLGPERRLAFLSQLVEQAEADLHADFKLLFEPLLDDPDPAIRALAIEGLWERDDEAFARRLDRLLRRDADEEVRAQAAAALGPFILSAEEDDDWSPELLASHALLLDVAADEAASAELRRQALVAAAHSVRSSVTGLIGTFLATEDRLLRAGGLRAAGNAMDKSFARELLEALDDPDPLLRHEAAMASGDMGLGHAVAPLANLAEFDPDLEVRLAAIAALGNIGSRPAVRALERMQTRLDPDDEDLGDAVEDALAMAELMGDLTALEAEGLSLTPGDDDEEGLDLDDLMGPDADEDSDADGLR